MADLADLFSFDFWANRRWLDWLSRRGLPEPHTSIFRHILSAQATWADRCEGHSPDTLPDIEPVEPELVRLNQVWMDLVARVPAAQIVSYRRTNGEPLQTPFGTIARHVINHGTYHRGELRGLLRAAGDTEFPETDLVAYALAVRPA